MGGSEATCAPLKLVHVRNIVEQALTIYVCSTRAGAPVSQVLKTVERVRGSFVERRLCYSVKLAGEVKSQLI
jgi:hypothetical protein